MNFIIQICAIVAILFVKMINHYIWVELEDWKLILEF